jgi:meiosis-specific transcription factor NDT80
MGVSARDNYTTHTPGLQRHPHALSPRYSDISRYHSQPDTPRSVLPTTMPLNNYSTGYQTASYSTHSASSESPPFSTQENYGTITSEGATIIPNIDAKIEKGFFLSSDRVWTCYRRNYFAVNVSFGLTPWTPNARLYLDQGNGKPQEQIQSMAVSLAAAVDGTAGKTIELIQHTPKRDKGPQLPMKKELLAPNPPGKSHDHSGYGLSNFHQPPSAPGPQLPLQADSDSSQQYSPASHASSNSLHAFERIQFKSATANNGKRRAQQQYYHLIVELWANIQNARDQEPRWVKVAAKMSHPVVVRGRSPSHYQNEGPHNATARGPGSSGFGGSGQNGLGSRGATSYSSYGNGLSGNGTTPMGGSMYRGNTYSVDPSPAGSHSVSSASSMSGGPVEGLVGDQHMVDEDDTKMMGGSHDYQYYPSGLYEGLPSKAEGTLPLPERRSVKEEFPGPASISTGWQIGGCGRFTGMESSRGYYPDVHAHTGY